MQLSTGNNEIRDATLGETLRLATGATANG